MQNDAELLDAWRGGDMASGSELFRRHVAVVSRFFANKVGDEREDLIQRTFLACVESRDRIRDGSTFGAYVLRVARNQLQDHYRAKQGKEFDTLATSVAHVGETPSQMLFRGERDRLLAAALRSVPLDLQITLELYYWERLSVNELAEVLGIAAGTVKSRLHEARQRVREGLSALLGGERSAALPSVEDLEQWIGSMRTRIGHMASGS
ncbi:MAG TPA: sigma-70 family RNA polymerase sigma factor [Nannocystaceae bacterium]|nr:sigma-70 family RNA polymerase sigma factor [Nannocystaceae bacterium]